MKRSRAYYCTIAALGLILQTGVMAMAGVGSWYLQWTKNGEPKTLVKGGTFMSERDAAVTFLLGTLFLCAGMLSCAALVGQSTHERYYRRRETTKERLLWLQPGKQVIGDQTFDAFAYFDNPGKPLLEYTISTKTPDDTSSTHGILDHISNLRV